MCVCVFVFISTFTRRSRIELFLMVFGGIFTIMVLHENAQPTGKIKIKKKK